MEESASNLINFYTNRIEEQKLKIDKQEQELQQHKQQIDELIKYLCEVRHFELEILDELPNRKMQPEYYPNVARLNLAECVLSKLNERNEE